MISPIFVAFLLLAALLLWFIIGARGKWWLKLVMIVLVPAFMFQVWHSLASFSGWPTTYTPPKAAFYVYGYVIEPDANQKIKGAVYLWLIPSKTSHGAFDYSPTLGEPRAYKLPYSKKLEGQVQQANGQVNKGQQVAFQTKKSSGKGHGHAYQSGHKNNGKYIFYNLRPPVLPRKNSR